MVPDSMQDMQDEGLGSDACDGRAPSSLLTMATTLMFNMSLLMLPNRWHWAATYQASHAKGSACRQHMRHEWHEHTCHEHVPV